MLPKSINETVDIIKKAAVQLGAQKGAVSVIQRVSIEATVS